MFCHKCGTQLEDGQTFCHKCGTKMVYDEVNASAENVPSRAAETSVDSGGILRRCPVCKAVNSGFAKICTECGADMDALLPPEEPKPDDPPKTFPEAPGRSQPEAGEMPNDSGGILRRCPVCKTVNSGFARFCTECGADMNSQPAVSEETHAGKPIGEQPKATYSDKNSQTASNESNHAYTEWAYAGKVSDDSEYDSKEESAPEYFYSESKSSGFRAWWQGLSGFKKALIVIAAIAAVIFILVKLGSVLFKVGLILIGLVLTVGLILAIFTGSNEEKSTARRAIFGLFSVAAGIAVVVGAVSAYNNGVFDEIISNFSNGALDEIISSFSNGAFDESAVYDIIKPGAMVREAYLTQYSDTVTIEQAFENYFSDGKWSTYKSEGYEYVVFTGTCLFADEPADARITFKVTGQYFTANSLEINGVDMGVFMLAAVLEDVYDEY